MNFCKTILAVSIAAASASTVMAAETMTEKPGVPTLGQVMEATGISVNGYIDMSYTWLSGSGAFTGMGMFNRVFDTERRSFNVNAVDLTLAALPPEGFGGMVNLTAGSDAKYIASAGSDGCAFVACPSADEFDVTQAYVHFDAHFATGGLMVIGGKYVTLAGAELIKSPANLNFSRSILFGYAMPFTHTGVRAYFTPGGRPMAMGMASGGEWTFIAGLNNGWDVLKESTQLAATDGTQGLGKTVELGVSGAITKSLSLVAVYYRGNESGATSAIAPATTGQRTLLDLVLTFTATDNLNFVLNYDKGEQDKVYSDGSKAKWSGLAAYASYKLSDAWRVAFRTESFDDKVGLAGDMGFRTGVMDGQKWKENTLTLAYAPAKNVELRGEVRKDKSNQSSFVQPDGTTKKSQDSFGLEAIYKF